MDNVIESLSDSSTLPELSYEEFADSYPFKKLPESVYSSENDDLDEENKNEKDDSLHTPGPKRKLQQPISQTVNEQKKTNTLGTPTPPTTPKTIQMLSAAAAPSPSSTTAIGTKSDTNTSISTPVLLNSKIALSKTNITPQTIVKIATTPKSLPTTSIALNVPAVSSTLTTSASTPKTTTLGTVTTIDGKTALKTNNGQILYIQRGQTKGSATAVAVSAGTLLGSNKEKNASTTLRINPSTAIPTSTAARASSNVATVKVEAVTNPSAGGNNNIKTLTTTAPATANISGNKTVIQVIRSADGKLVRLMAQTGNGKGPFTLSPTVAAQLAGKKIITASGGQVVLKTGAATTDASSLKRSTSSETGATVAEPIVTTAKPIKIQKIITPSTVALTTTTITPTATSTLATPSTAATKSLGTVSTAGGKTFVQGTRVVVPSSEIIKLPQTLVGSTATVSSASTSSSGNVVSSSGTGNTSLSSGALRAIHIPGKPGLQYVRVFTAPKKTQNISATAAPATATATPATTATVAASAKLLNTMSPKFTVRPNSTGKIILTKSPKVDGIPVLSPIAANNLKTLVTVPTIRKITNSSESPTTSSQSPITSVTLVKNNASPGATVVTNVVSASGIQRPKPKISEINSEIQRMATSTTETKKVINGSDGKRYLAMPRSMLRTSQSVTSQNNGVAGQQQQQQQRKVQQPQVYSVVKSTTPSSIASANASEGGMKSFIICKTDQSDSSIKAIQVKRPTTQTQQPELSQQRQTSQSRDDEESRKITTTTSSTSQNHNNKFVPIKIKMEPMDGDDLTSLMFQDEAIVRGGVRRKHCNCSKSQCLKLYCDCFANGEFCQDCTCKDCFNNLQYEDERQRAIKSCLERNPSAFKPKITTSSDQGDTRLHNKGCNCKRSGCLKNYCECFEAKIPCSSNCKCVGCRNIEDRPDLDMDPIDTKLLESIASSSNASNTIARAVSTSNLGYERSFIKKERKRESESFDENEMTRAGRKRTHLDDDITGSAALLVSPQLGDGNVDADDDAAQITEKRNTNFITQEVIDATIQCMISQADECVKKNLPTHQIEKMVMEELGRCLVEIIDFSIRNTDTSFSQN